LRRASVLLFIALLGSVFLGEARSAATTAPAPGSASTTVQGTAQGVTISNGDGTYRLTGTFEDAGTGAHGTYQGTLVNIGDYTTCNGNHGIGCILDPATGQIIGNCNVVAGQVTFREQGQSWVTPISSTFRTGSHVASVCARLGDPAVHDLYLDLAGSTFNPEVDTFGFIGGVSTPLGAIYRDAWTFRFTVATG
jgi:hypothetical protein